MSGFADTTLVVLGAGLSSRFGSDKLAQDFDGRPVAHHLLTAIAPFRFAQKLLVARAQAWTRQFHEAGFEVIDNPEPRQGQSHSLRLALARSDAGNVLVMLADMPFVTADHLVRLEHVFIGGDGNPVASGGEGYRGPPALFRRTTLLEGDLEGDQGARGLLADAHPVMADPALLADIDTREDLRLLTAPSQHV